MIPVVEKGGVLGQVLDIQFFDWLIGPGANPSK